MSHKLNITLMFLLSFAAAQALWAQSSEVYPGGVIRTYSPVAMEGEIHVLGIMSGLIELQDDLRSDPTSGAGGLIHIGGDVRGQIECDKDLENSGSIVIDGAIYGLGTIEVTGQCDGDISVGESTSSNTLIHCSGGLGSNGTIITGTTEGSYPAAGKIVVGSLHGDPVTADYDGCIQVMDDLTGRIRVAVCDDNAVAHRICVDGSVSGTIEIDDDGCDNQPGYTCEEPCTP